MPLSVYRQQELTGLDTDASCWRLYAGKGMTTRQIAEALGIAPSTVSRALRRAEKRALESLNATISAHKVKAMERLEMLYQMALAAWDDSCAERTRRRSKRRTAAGEAGAVDETEIVTESKRGNPRFMTEARAAVADMRKLMGLDAPARISVIDADRPFAELSDDDVRREMAAALHEAGATVDSLPPADGERTH